MLASCPTDDEDDNEVNDDEEDCENGVDHAEDNHALQSFTRLHLYCVLLLCIY